MTAEAASALTPPGPTSSRTTRARIPRQRRNLEHINCAPCAPARNDANEMRADSVVIDLVAAARDGDKQAWDALVERYAPLVWSICRRHRLGRADADDVAQSVWLRLVDQLDRVREPAALPGWLATTTRRECIRVSCAARGPHASIYPLDVESLPDTPRRHGRPGTAGSRAARGAARGVRPAAVRTASSCSPCSSRTRPCPTPTSAPGWASPSAASARPAAATWTRCAATRPSPRCYRPSGARWTSAIGTQASSITASAPSRGGRRQDT